MVSGCGGNTPGKRRNCDFSGGEKRKRGDIIRRPEERLKEISP
jgi:hypothetical protein